ncbi:Alcohol acetyltransferase [Pestalotiopsis sp. IQ-011]
MSGKIFHQHLLRRLNQGFALDPEPVLKHAEGSASWLLDLPNDTDRLPPNPEKLSWWLMEPKFFFSALWKELEPPSIFPPGNEHAHWAPIKLTLFATRFRTFSADIDTVTKLVNTCREHHTTLTGLTQALAPVSLTCALDSQKGFASRTPYDLRHILPSNPPNYRWLQPKDTMCNYVSVVDHEYDSQLVASIRTKMPTQTKNASLPPGVVDIVWSVAARVGGKIKARLNSGLVDDWIGIMKFVSDWRAQQQGESDKTRYLSWLVTNLGVLDRDIGQPPGQAGGWSARRAELVLSAEVPSAAISISMVTVKDEQICVTCSWQDCVVDAELGARVLGDLERWLNQIIS